MSETESKTRGSGKRESRRKTKGRGREGRGVLGTIFTGTLVVAAGFAIGVVAGLALEDPSLVKDFATGETRPVEIEDSVEAPPDVDAAPARDAGLRPPPLNRLGFSVQVGAFAESGAARRLAEELEADGYPVYVAKPRKGSEAEGRWRVRVGPVSTRARADRVAEELRSRRSLPTWVLDESAS